MYLIVGLGNPENDYANTRHNMGFNVINKLAERYNIEVKKNKFKALYGMGEIEGEKVILIKPQTFMNLSGEAVVQFVNFYKISLKNLLIIYDDIDTEPSKIRIRKFGSSGNHNGMKSIIQLLGTDKFPRIRIGIGKPQEQKDLVSHVIGVIEKEDIESLVEGIKKGEAAVIEVVKNNLDFAMNKYN